jgi:hypothetical protein
MAMGKRAGLEWFSSRGHAQRQRPSKMRDSVHLWHIDYGHVVGSFGFATLYSHRIVRVSGCVQCVWDMAKSHPSVNFCVTGELSDPFT